MKYLVLSDSHGNVDNMVRAVELTKPDGIIHLGDGWRDAEELHTLYPRLPLEQVTKQLNKLINVIKIVELEDRTSVQRELLLVKVKADG